jgi:hypothetical protein
MAAYKAWKTGQGDSQDSSPGAALFFTAGWREALCKCEECTKYYEDVPFLLDPEDTVLHYEANSKGPDEGIAALILEATPFII